MAINTYLSIITLNVNGLNALTKRHRMADWIIKQEPTTRCLQKTHFWAKDTHRLKMRGWKKIFHANTNHKKWGGGHNIISDKIDFKTKAIGTSLVAQWLRICLPMQGTRVWTLVREDPTCYRATKPMSCNYWACTLEPKKHNYWARVPQLLKPACPEPCYATRKATAMRSMHTTMKSSSRSLQLEKAHVQQWRPNAAKNK